MKNTSTKTNRMVKIAMIGAIYAAITFATFFMSFGAIQYRVSEVLTVLPAYTSLAIPGLGIGCAAANLMGFFMGVNPIGWIDAIFGTLATVIAALLSRQFGKLDNKLLRYILVPLPPVLANAVIVGLELTIVFQDGSAFFPMFLTNAVSVGIGQAVICYALGIPFMMVLSKNEFYKKIFAV